MADPVNPNVNPNTAPNVNVSVPPEPKQGSTPQAQANVSPERAAPPQGLPQGARSQGGASLGGHTQERQRSSTLIQNPKRLDEGRPVEKAPTQIPQSTINEMAAGQAALKRNAPTAAALEAAREKLNLDKNKA